MADMEKDVEMKLVKFKYSVKKATQYFSRCDSYYYMPFNLPLKNYDEYYKNLFLAVVFDTIFFKPIKGGKSGPSIEEWDEALKLLNYDSQLLPNCNNSNTQAYLYEWKGSIIFWALVMASIDDEFYNNEINMISDLAYLLGYTEDMMLDWLSAVKYFLNGKIFNMNIQLEFKTAEANKFFKGKEED